MGDPRGQTDTLLSDSYPVSGPFYLTPATPHKNRRTTIANTSSTGLAAGRPALESPLIAVRLFQEHIIAPNEGQQVLVDDILVGQATSGFTLSRGENLEGETQRGRHKIRGRSRVSSGSKERSCCPQLPDGVPKCALRLDPFCAILPIKMCDPVPSWGRWDIHKLPFPRRSTRYVCTKPYSSQHQAHEPFSLPRTYIQRRVMPNGWSLRVSKLSGFNSAARE